MLTSSADVQAVRRLLDAELRATQAADVDRLMSLRSDDFVSMPPQHPPIEGRPAVRDFFRQLFSAFRPTGVDFAFQDVVVSGDLAFARGSFEWILMPSGHHRPVADNGKMIMIARRQRDGSWKLTRAIWNADARLPVAD